VTATGTQLQATYTYDVQGKRVEQDVWTPGTGLVTTRYAYDGDQVWAELSGTNVVQTRYLWGQGQTQLFARTDVGVGLLWEDRDHLGSVRDVVSADGTTVLDHVEYGGFGAIASETNAPTGGNILYTGLRLDRATGIVWADGRTLLVTTGQWMQEDPIQFQAGDDNLRRYVGNDPVNLTDPSGLQAAPRKKYRLPPISFGADFLTNPRYGKDSITVFVLDNAANHKIGYWAYSQVDFNFVPTTIREDRTDNWEKNKQDRTGTIKLFMQHDPPFANDPGVGQGFYDITLEATILAGVTPSHFTENKGTAGGKTEKGPVNMSATSFHTPAEMVRTYHLEVAVLPRNPNLRRKVEVETFIPIIHITAGSAVVAGVLKVVRVDWEPLFIRIDEP
jgi:RHS repeat-associated protein